MNCQTCESRGRISEAAKFVADTPMCIPCYSGKAVHPDELLGEPKTHQGQIDSRKSVRGPHQIRMEIVKAVRRRLESRQ